MIHHLEWPPALPQRSVCGTASDMLSAPRVDTQPIVVTGSRYGYEPHEVPMACRSPFGYRHAEWGSLGHCRGGQFVRACCTALLMSISVPNQPQ